MTGVAERSPVIVNGRFLTHPFTGVQRYAYEVTRRLPAVRIVAPSPPVGDYAGLDAGRVEVRGRPLGGHVWEELVLPWAVSRSSLLWSPAGSGPVAVTNQVVTIHDVSHLEHPEWYGRAFTTWYRLAHPLLVRRVRLVLTVSEYSRARLIAMLGIPPDRVVAVPEGVDERFRPRPEAAVAERLRGLGIRCPYVLAVGSVIARKNFSRLFAAWREVMGELDGIELVVVGRTGLVYADTPGHGDLPRRVRPIEHVPDDALVDLYSGALAFVYPSLIEGFGLPVLEAMACGTPVVASSTTSLPEVAGDAAVLVDPYDAGAIADGIRRVVGDDGLRQQLRGRGLARAAELSWDRTAARVWDVLRHELAAVGGDGW